MTLPRLEFKAPGTSWLDVADVLGMALIGCGKM
jgi:hypothetical protein